VRRTFLAIGLLLALGAGLIALTPATATIEDERRALVKAKQDAAEAEKRSGEFDTRARNEQDEAAKARAQEAAIAARIQQAEADIKAAEARIRIIARLQDDHDAALAAKQGPVVRLTGALQMMSRRPPVLALVQPGSTSDLVHVRMLLAGILPVIEKRTAGLRADIDQARALRQSAELAARSLRVSREGLQTQRLALSRLEADHRLRSAQFADSAMFESERAIGLGEKARDIVDLMAVIEDQAGLREELAALPGPLMRPAQPGAAPIPQSGRAARAQGGGPYRLPVVGDVVTGMGEVAQSGARAKGLTFAVQPDAQVVAPNRGRIVFAAPYRGFGRIVIIDHGGGWTSLLTNMAILSVKVGDVVEQGSPLGRAGTDRPRVTVELRRNGRPIDITPLVG